MAFAAVIATALLAVARDVMRPEDNLVMAGVCGALRWHEAFRIVAVACRL